MELPALACSRVTGWKGRILALPPIDGPSARQRQASHMTVEGGIRPPGHGGEGPSAAQHLRFRPESQPDDRAGRPVPRQAGCLPPPGAVSGARLDAGPTWKRPMRRGECREAPGTEGRKPGARSGGWNLDVFPVHLWHGMG